MGATALVCYFQPHGFSEMSADPFAAARGRSIAFSLLALSPLFHAFNCRSPVASMLVLRPRLPLMLIVAVGISAAIHLVSVLVPGLRPLFSTFVLSTAEWMIMLGLAASIIPFVELGKLAQLVLTRMRGRSGAGAVSAAAMVIGCLGVALLGACAGSATTTSASATKVHDPSIGELAARQGGLLGGGPGPRTEEAPAALRARTLTPAIDGAVSEWPELDEVTQAEMGSSPSTLAAAIAVDDTNLYLAGEVHDATPDPGDAAELDLQIPPGERNPRLSLFVHLDGKRGRVERRTEATRPHVAAPLAARVAVQPLDCNGGATFEAAIPWSELGDGRTVRVGHARRLALPRRRRRTAGGRRLHRRRPAGARSRRCSSTWRRAWSRLPRAAQPGARDAGSGPARRRRRGRTEGARSSVRPAAGGPRPALPRREGRSTGSISARAWSTSTCATPPATARTICSSCAR